MLIKNFKFTYFVMSKVMMHVGYIMIILLITNEDEKKCLNHVTFNVNASLTHSKGAVSSGQVHW